MRNIRGTDDIPIKIPLARSLRVDGIACRQSVISRQNRYQWFAENQFVFEFRVGFAPQERHVEFAALEIVSKVNRKSAEDPYFQIGQVVLEDVHRGRDAVDFVSRQEAHSEDRLFRLRDTPGGLDRSFRLSERQSCVIEKGPAGSGEFNSSHAALRDRASAD
jgi:hypothetical protein